MPIETIPQPEVLPVSPALRLRRYDGVCGFALPWYQDAGTVLLVDGDAKRYTPERLERMYAYQDAHGELYWIEVLEGGSWRPVGDVCLSRDDLAIVIGERSCRGRGVGASSVTFSSGTPLRKTESSSRRLTAGSSAAAAIRAFISE